jgi:hypothetical protein
MYIFNCLERSPRGLPRGLLRGNLAGFWRNYFLSNSRISRRAFPGPVTIFIVRSARLGIPTVLLVVRRIRPYRGTKLGSKIHVMPACATCSAPNSETQLCCTQVLYRAGTLAVLTDGSHRSACVAGTSGAHATLCAAALRASWQWRAPAITVLSVSAFCIAYAQRFPFTSL